MRFRNREHAGELLAAALTPLRPEDPIVLAIPRGGAAVGAPIARALGCELDVLLVRKLRHPLQPELAIGAIGEDDAEHVAPWALRALPAAVLDAERARQRTALSARSSAYRAARPRAEIVGRCAIVVDDGAATGQTFALALGMARARQPRRLIAAVPVASPEALRAIEAAADDVVCLDEPRDFRAVGEQYDDFAPVTEAEVVRLLSEAPG